MSGSSAHPEAVTTGIPGLDDVLGGGLPANRLFLIQGDPGVGKTTMALQFLLAGVAAGERTLYITLSETEEEIQAIAASHGWSLKGTDLFELSALEQTQELEASNTLFIPSEVDLRETTSTLLKRVEAVAPSRVVFDSLSEIRLLSQTSVRYRREILALKRYFAGRKCTVLLLDDRSAGPADLQLESLAHGVITLDQLVPGYGADRRRLRVSKLRGVQFRSGYHDFIVKRGGLEVFPRLVAAEHTPTFKQEPVPSGIAELDALLGGGLETGTSTLLMGPAGAGKSNLAAQYASAVAKRGHRSLMFCFEEGRSTLLGRADALGMNLSKWVEKELVVVKQIDPAEMGPGEFANLATKAVEDSQTRLVVIDSLNGYLNAMPDEKFLALQIHELLSYLNRRGLTTLLLMAQHGLVGSMETPADVTFLADGVILMRYFEAEGSIRKAISVVKKRGGRHEDTIREWSFGASGIRVGPVLTDFRGVLTGTPTHVGTKAKLMRGRED